MAAPVPADEGTATPVLFDPGLDLSPYTLFRRLEEGRPPRLVDVRPSGGSEPRLSLAGAAPAVDAAWRPEADEEVVLFDDDGVLASAAARRLQAAGCTGARALFGGLRLYDFALDPQVVGEERFLVRTGG